MKDFLKSVTWIICETEAISVQYEVLEQLGEPGTYGTAFRCVHKKSGQERAVKVIKKEGLSKDECMAVRKEVLILNSVNHINVIKVDGVFESEKALYIVTELCRGGELFELMSKYTRFSEPIAAKVIDQLLSGLQHLHARNIAHCDLKPDNFLLMDVDSVENVKIIDMGMAQMVKPGKFLHEMLGTAYYIAPEVLKQSYSCKCDLFSVGVILFAMVFGYMPFSATDIDSEELLVQRQKGFDPTVKDGQGAHFPRTPVSAELKDLLGKLLATDPCQRLDAQQASAHPWLVAQRAVIAKDPRQILLPKMSSGGQGTGIIVRPPTAYRPPTVHIDKEQEPRKPLSQSGQLDGCDNALKKHSKAKGVALGLKIDDTTGKEYPEVVEVMKGLPACNAGLMVGDLVSRVNGVPIKTMEHFKNAMVDILKSGAMLNFTILRNKQPMRFSVTLPTT